jgi:hypothetical protein
MDRGAEVIAGIILLIGFVLAVLSLFSAYRRLNPLVRALVGSLIGPVVCFLYLKQVTIDPFEYLLVFVMLPVAFIIALGIEAFAVLLRMINISFFIK